MTGKPDGRRRGSRRRCRRRGHLIDEVEEKHWYRRQHFENVGFTTDEELGPLAQEVILGNRTRHLCFELRQQELETEKKEDPCSRVSKGVLVI